MDNALNTDIKETPVGINAASLRRTGLLAISTCLVAAVGAAMISGGDWRGLGILVPSLAVVYQIATGRYMRINSSHRGTRVIWIVFSWAAILFSVFVLFGGKL